jgi:DNA-binding response OmpR family regulator
MSLAKRRILCVEDHEDTRFMLTHLLEREGYYVIAAEDATLGLALTQTQSFDLLILDVWLPDGDGNKLCRRVREFDHYTPIIIYSGAAHESDQHNAWLAEADAFVAKPNIDELLERIKYFLD